MNVNKYKVFCLICHHIGSMKYSNLVVLRTTLGKMCYMQISTAITENMILLNISGNIHDNVSKKVSIPRFSWSRIKIKALEKLSHQYISSICKLVTTIDEKAIFPNKMYTDHTIEYHIMCPYILFHGQW